MSTMEIQIPDLSGCRVLIVDDEPALRIASGRLLAMEGFEVGEAERGEEALAKLEAFDPHVVVTDLRMPGMSGLDLLRAIKTSRPDIEVIVITGHGTVEAAVQALQEGAFHFLIKPVDPLELLVQTVCRATERHQMARRIESLVEDREGADRFEGMVGASPSMQRVFRLVESIAGSDAPVLVLGDSGTGKELVARAIHNRSRRARRPFVAVNCAALQESLLESELFGYVRGAFTGAATDRMGLLESADGGTLFLDEIGEMSAPLQAKLLRALENGEVRRVGGVSSRIVDVRVVGATNQDLQRAVTERRFREDLFYRINVFQIPLPPLRARGDDVIVVGRAFLDEYANGEKRFSDDALALMRSYHWPGNIRELRNAIQYAVAVTSGGTIEAADFPDGVKREASAATPAMYQDLLDLPYGDARAGFLEQFERLYVRHRMEQAGGSLSSAARLSEMDRSNFRRLAKRCGVHQRVVV